MRPRAGRAQLLDSLTEAIASQEFLAGLRWGAITAGVGLLIGLAWRVWRHQGAPLIGLATSGAAALAMDITRPLPDPVWAGLGLLAAAGAAFSWTRRVPVLPVLFAIPGAWLIGRSGLPGDLWVMVLAISVITVGGPLISSFSENADGSPIPAWLFSISVAGVWATVPDTEEALVLLGAVALPTLLAWPLRVARLGPSGTHVLLGIYMWMVVWGGRGREGSIVGASAALGMLLAAPVGARIAGKRSVTTAGGTGLWLIVAHLLVVAVVTRLAGLRDSALAALGLALPALVAAALLWVVLESRSPRSVVDSGPRGREITSEDV